MKRGFVMLVRGDITEALLRKPKAFTLLTQIALRTRRTKATVNLFEELEIGEAFIGDYVTVGLTEAEYRHAKEFLLKKGLIEVMRTTNKGTVVRLSGDMVYNVNGQGNNQVSEPYNGQAPLDDLSRSIVVGLDITENNGQRNNPTTGNATTNEQSIQSKTNKEDIVFIVDYLNANADTGYRANGAKTKKHITARLNEGYTVEDCIAVIDKKVQEWKDGEMEKYLRPETLFGTKFEGYLNQKINIKEKNVQKGNEDIESANYETKF